NMEHRRSRTRPMLQQGKKFMEINQTWMTGWYVPMMKIQIASVLLLGVVLLGCETTAPLPPPQASQQVEPASEEVTTPEQTPSGEEEEPAARTVQVTLNHSQEYEFPTGMGGDEQGARISRGPAHALKSEMVRDLSTNFEPVYRYQPEPGYVGTDQVEITLVDIEIGSGPDDTTTTETTVLIELEIVAE
ncbi:MAG: hypothetical protein QGH11_11855, partial [Pirellulaceae bacterium]|nr:hypothetical protein [Pirellulaceae bacterium]